MNGDELTSNDSWRVWTVMPKPVVRQLTTGHGGAYHGPMGRVVHFEIHAADPERAAVFYAAVFGWSINRWGEERYWLVTTGPDGEAGINGAILPRMGDAPAVGAPVVGAVNTVSVDDLDAALAKALASGGAMALDKMVIPGVGTVAYMLDTEANVVGVLQPETSAAG